MLVKRSDILDYVTYEEVRERVRADVLAIKSDRRIHVGKHLTFLFENAATVRYQIQEMVRAEKIVKEADILHEIETYNELLPAPGGLGATLLIEIADAAERPRLLTEWRQLPAHLYVRLEDGTKVYAEFDPRQVGDDRLSSVQYLKFGTRGRVPVALGADHPALGEEAALTPAQRSALAADLGA